MDRGFLLAETEDGSHTLYSKQFKAYYHSTYGAVQESLHVFVRAGLDYYMTLNPEADRINVLEYGLGSCLNAALAAKWALQKKCCISYVGLEAFPPDPQLLISSNLTDRIGQQASYNDVVQAPWEEKKIINPFFSIRKIKVDFCSTVESYCPQIIFYDAFGPSVQPELWSEEMLSMTWAQLEKGGILVTFCAKGSFKRALRSIGYEVQRLPGPPGKREMTRALKV